MTKVSVKLDDNKTEDILGAVGSPSIVLSELIKNSIDSNSEIVDIYIDTNKKEVTVIDKGDGLNEEDIKKLGVIGQSDKKEIGKEKRKDGKYYGGSKGLGLLSAFSLSDYIEIETRIDDTVYLVKWQKSQGEFSYQQIDNYSLDSNGTKVILKNISDDNMNILMDKNEHKKLRHVTIQHFNNIGYENKKINFYVNGVFNDEFECSNINDLLYRFVYEIEFEYNSKNNILKYSFNKVNMSSVINNGNLPNDRLLKPIYIDLSTNIKISDIIKNKYKIVKTVQKDKSFNYLSAKLENFCGKFYISEGRNSKKHKSVIEKFGYGVKVFINDFAIYEYLDNENDWLRFSNLSQNIKNTTLKPHNVFGYINFENFNEKESNLEIANERTNFIQKSPYKKFVEIIKDIVVQLTFEVDVAYRNKNVDSENYFEDFGNENDKQKENKHNNTENQNMSEISQNNIETTNEHRNEIDSNKKDSNTDDSRNNKEKTESNSNESTDKKEYKGNDKSEENSNQNDGTDKRENEGVNTNKDKEKSKQNQDNNDKKKKSNKKNTNKLNRKYIVPNGFRLVIEQSRVNKIFRELRTLDVDQYNNAVAVVFRVFIELSIDSYIARKQVPKVSEHTELYKKINKVGEFMKDKGILSATELKPVTNLATNPNDYSSVNTLNAYVHNINQQPLSDSLKQTWDNIQIFIEKLWEL